MKCMPASFFRICCFGGQEFITNSVSIVIFFLERPHDNSFFFSYALTSSDIFFSIAHSFLQSRTFLHYFFFLSWGVCFFKLLFLSLTRGNKGLRERIKCVNVVDARGWNKLRISFSPQKTSTLEWWKLFLSTLFLPLKFIFFLLLLHPENHVW